MRKFINKWLARVKRKLKSLYTNNNRYLNEMVNLLIVRFIVG